MEKKKSFVFAFSLLLALSLSLNIHEWWKIWDLPTIEYIKILPQICQFSLFYNRNLPLGILIKNRTSEIRFAFVMGFLRIFVFCVNNVSHIH